jgi:hypothetical protein
MMAWPRAQAIFLLCRPVSQVSERKKDVDQASRPSPIFLCLEVDKANANRILLTCEDVNARGRAKPQLSAMDKGDGYIQDRGRHGVANASATSRLEYSQNDDSFVIASKFEGKAVRLAG